LLLLSILLQTTWLLQILRNHASCICLPCVDGACCSACSTVGRNHLLTFALSVAAVVVLSAMLPPSSCRGVMLQKH
jgi:hypothetical protein